MRTAFLDQTRIQFPRFGCAYFQRENKGMGQVETGGIQITACFAAICRPSIEPHQRRFVTLSMGLQQLLIQF